MTESPSNQPPHDFHAWLSAGHRPDDPDELRHELQQALEIEEELATANANLGAVLRLIVTSDGDVLPAELARRYGALSEAALAVQEALIGVAQITSKTRGKGAKNSPSAVREGGIPEWGRRMALVVAETRQDLDELRSRMPQSASVAPDNYVPLQTAAAFHKFSDEAVRTWVNQNLVKAVRLGGRWHVDLESLAAFASLTPRERGAMSKSAKLARRKPRV